MIKRDPIWKRALHAVRSNKGSEEIRKDDPEKMQGESAVIYSYVNHLHGKFESMTNPDKLVRVKGAKIYNKMLLDDQVQAAFNLKLNIIISRPMRFISTGPGQEEIIKFFERNINDLISGTWLSALRGILMGKAYGFSLNEKVYRAEEVDGKLRWVIDRIVPKPYNSFLFDTDKYGNLKNIKQEVDTGFIIGKTKKLNPDKFIRYVNKPEMDPIWGQSDLKPAYRSYWEKDITSKYWDIYIERMAGGFVTVNPSEKAGNLGNSDRTTLESALKNLTGLSGIIMPKGYEAEMHTPKKNDAFEKRIQQLDKQIARSVLIPNLLGFSEQGDVGSYAQSQTQLDVFMMLIKEDGDYLADVLNEQLFSQLAFWNFGVKDYPRAQFDDFTNEQKRFMAEAWVKAVRDSVVTNTPADELHTRSLLQYPIPEDGVIEKTADEDKNDKETDDGKVGEEETKKSGDDSSKDEGKADIPTEKEVIQDNSEPVHRVMAHSEIRESCTHGIPVEKGIVSKKIAGRTVDHQEDAKKGVSFADRVLFDTVGDGLDRIEGKFFSDMSMGVDKAFGEISAVIADFKSSGKDGTVGNINKALEKAISPDTKRKLSSSIRTNLNSTYNLGWNTSHKATEKAAKQNEASNKFIKQIQDVVLLSEKRICKENEWTFAHFVDGISLDAADAWFRDRAFTITGDISQAMIENAAIIMEEGIRDDWSVKNMTDELRNVLSGLTGGTDKQERARLDTIVRTNMSTIFTQAQLAFYNDPALNGFVEALEYSAVLDNRTTEICNRLNGSIYAINNSIWRFITPPNHFQCRSILIPVTLLDTWNEDKKGFNKKQLPGKGFGQSGLANMFKIDLA